MNNELKHYGVLGMKWGVRRYQNKDGSLTPAGKKRAKERIENINQKIKKGSLHSIVGLALEDQGYKKGAVVFNKNTQSTNPNKDEGI